MDETMPDEGHDNLWLASVLNKLSISETDSPVPLSPLRCSQIRTRMHSSASPLTTSPRVISRIHLYVYHVYAANPTCPLCRIPPPGIAGTLVGFSGHRQARLALPADETTMTMARDNPSVSEGGEARYRRRRGASPFIRSAPRSHAHDISPILFNRSRTPSHATLPMPILRLFNLRRFSHPHLHHDATQTRPYSV
ncbi:hypothetical protein E4T56_gene3647 [Termitomyces sp. T112]|nr:hypothetical protein E4T56_gene3647 [Termitomyces sp. T112]